MTTQVRSVAIRLTEVANRLHPVTKQKIGRAAPEFLLRAQAVGSDPQAVYAAALQAVASRGFRGTHQKEAAFYLIATVLLASNGNAPCVSFARIPPFLAQRTLADQSKQHLDGPSEMAGTESLRLQMAMDRMSKLMETLCHLLESMENTDQGITQNLK